MSRRNRHCNEMRTAFREKRKLSITGDEEPKNKSKRPEYMTSDDSSNVSVSSFWNLESLERLERLKRYRRMAQNAEAKSVELTARPANPNEQQHPSRAREQPGPSRPKELSSPEVSSTTCTPPLVRYPRVEDMDLELSSDAEEHTNRYWMY